MHRISHMQGCIGGMAMRPTDCACALYLCEKESSKPIQTQTTPWRSSMFVPRRKLVLADSQPLQHSDCPWDDELDSRQPRSHRQARALPVQAACLDQPSDLPASQQQLTPPAMAASINGQAQVPLGLATISLEAYQEAFSSLTRGTGSVQPVSMKEKALYKMSDLKQVRPWEENAAHSTNLISVEGSSH